MTDESKAAKGEHISQDADELAQQLKSAGEATAEIVRLRETLSERSAELERGIESQRAKLRVQEFAAKAVIRGFVLTELDDGDAAGHQ